MASAAAVNGENNIKKINSYKTCENVLFRPFECVATKDNAEVDPGFLERWFICITVWGFALLILSDFS